MTDYTVDCGRWWEETFFKGAKLPPSKRPEEDTEFISLPRALTEVVDRQTEYNWNPHQPRGRYALKLIRKVRDKLPSSLGQNLLLHCSIGLELDAQHAGDGVISISGYDLIYSAVRIDLKHRAPRDSRSPKGAVIVPFIGFSTSLRHASTQIANLLQQNLEEALERRSYPLHYDSVSQKHNGDLWKKAAG